MKRMTIMFLLTLPSFLWAFGSGEKPGPGLYAEFLTNRGNMIFRLDPDRTPLTVTNFCGLAEGSLPNEEKASGEPFFDGLNFYREATGYAVFSGDPTGDGTGGPGYTLPRETGALISTADPGILVMDGFPTESAGSRFFILLGGDAYLDSKYTAFGRLVSGSRTLRRIREGDIIESVKILRIGEKSRELLFNADTFDKYLDIARATEIKNFHDTNPDLADAILALGDDREKTPAGIYYKVLKTGNGGKPGSGDHVSMHYTGTFLNGTVFDSSRDKGQTFDFVLGKDGIISGWVEMVMDMQPGEVRKVIIPPFLAYGSQGYGPVEPDSWLVFEMELVSFSEE